jgi:hypothetical protein
MKTITSLFTLFCCAAIGACTRAPELSAPHQAAPDEAAGDGHRIDIPATVRRNLGITFATVQARRVASTIRVPGAFELRPLARHEYRMALSGRVQLAVDQYDPVEPGQVLFRFQSPVWPELLHEIIEGEQAMHTSTAEIDVAAAKITEAGRMLELLRGRIDALAEADFKRADLDVEAAVLEAGLPRLEAELKLAETKLANAERTREHALHRAAIAAGVSETELAQPVDVGGEQVPTYRTMDWIEVRATERGVVELLNVTDGAFVEPPASVLSTVDTAQVRFRALALQGDLPQLLGAVEARIVPPRSPDIPIGEAVAATMTFGLDAHPKERTMTLLATPEGSAPWIRPGVSAFLEIVVDSTEEEALAIPRSAIVQDGLEHVFFRRDPADPNVAIRTTADLGLSDGRWVVLESGARRGDEVVLAGVFELKLAMDRRGTSSGDQHVHPDGTTH